MVANRPDLVIGCGAGFAGDRFDAALPVIEALSSYDCPRYLIYEVLAERTLAIAQKLKLADPDKGYSPWLEKYLTAALPLCLANNIRIVANFGSANAAAAAHRIRQLAVESTDQLARQPKVAYVEGDDLLAHMDVAAVSRLPCIEGTAIDDSAVVAANAYLGASSLVNALNSNADVIVVGRTTDSALVLAPLIQTLNILPDDYDLLAAGILAGHLIECGSQITGGYFADPPLKPVDNLANTGFPVLEFSANGSMVVTKPANTGGVVNRSTVIEQLLYEIHDPSTYLTPDVILDLTGVTVTEDSENRVSVKGARGRKPTDTLKATVSLDAGWLGEAEISYAGNNALSRAELAASIIRDRLSQHGIEEDVRIDLIGASSVFDNNSSVQRPGQTPAGDGEYRLRAAVRSSQREVAEMLTDEVLALYCCGPAGGGGVRHSVTPSLTTASVLLDRDGVERRVKSYLLDESGELGEIK